MDINPALHHALIPKLTLQPLVENALYHGIKLKRSVGMIQISGKREGDTIVLQVADNGAGMTTDRLEALRRATKSNTRVGFGLSAVHQRLQLQFGREYGLSIVSQDGIGTTITVCIPYQEKESVL